MREPEPVTNSLGEVEDPSQIPPAPVLDGESQADPNQTPVDLAVEK